MHIPKPHCLLRSQWTPLPRTGSQQRPSKLLQTAKCSLVIVLHEAWKEGFSNVLYFFIQDYLISYREAFLIPLSPPFFTPVFTIGILIQGWSWREGRIFFSRNSCVIWHQLQSLVYTAARCLVTVFFLCLLDFSWVKYCRKTDMVISCII